MNNSDDIMADWKKARFMIVDGDWYDMPFKHMIVLTDVAFWAEHADQLKVWCKQYGCRPEGVTVCIPDDATLTLFTLRWS